MENNELMKKAYEKHCAAEIAQKHIFYVKKVLVDPMQKPDYTRIFLELNLKKFKGNVDDLEWAVIIFQPNDVTASITEVQKKDDGSVLCFCVLHDISTKFPKIKKGDKFFFFTNAYK